MRSAGQLTPRTLQAAVDKAGEGRAVGGAVAPKAGAGARKSGKGRGKGKAARKNYVHMLNSTLCACTRLICCILENYQTPLGVVVPEVLLRYMPPALLKTDEEGRKYLPFVEPLKVVEEKAK